MVTRKTTEGSYIVAITGASGILYGLRVLDCLLGKDCRVHLVISRNGEKVMAEETRTTPEEIRKAYAHRALTIYEDEDLFAPIASGTYPVDGMVVVPCSMATLGGLAAGSLGTLIGRAADVCLKERRRLILVPRETPLGAIHLRNMLTLSEAGTILLPAMPPFYGKPEKIGDLVDFIAGKVLDLFGFQDTPGDKWRNNA